VAGVQVTGVGGYNQGVEAVTDARGHFRLVGLPKRGAYVLAARPAEDSPLLGRSFQIPDTEGLQPLSCVIELARGVVVTGRLMDRATGQGLSGEVRFVPLAGNPYFARKPGYGPYRHERPSASSDADGRFRLTVYPGPGVLLARARGPYQLINRMAIYPYKPAVLDPADRLRLYPDGKGDNNRFTAVDNSVETLCSESAYKLLDLAEDAEGDSCELYADPGKTLRVKVQDADGKPLSGVVASGLTACWPITFPLQADECTVFALDPERPRELAFYHAERRLAGVLKVRGDEPEPPAVRLVPTGTVTGRVLDADGQPVVGAEVQPDFNGDELSELYRLARLRQEAVRTDRDGRFRLDGLIPEMSFVLAFHKGRDFLVREPTPPTTRVRSGATLDLGDLRVKPLRP
jgi:hypothetical protein